MTFTRGRRESQNPCSEVMDKLYLITRSDLEDGPKAVQAIHAAIEYSMHHPKACRAWYESSNTVALLEARDERALNKLLDRAREIGATFVEFREPDLSDQLTAVVFGPEAKGLCRHLPLAYAKDG